MPLRTDLAWRFRRLWNFRCSVTNPASKRGLLGTHLLPRTVHRCNFPLHCAFQTLCRSPFQLLRAQHHCSRLPFQAMWMTARSLSTLSLAPPDADTSGESLLWRIVIPFVKSNFCCVYTSFSRSIFPTRAWPFRRLMRTFEHHAALERWILPFQLQSCPSPANSPRSCPTTPTAPAPHQTFVTPSVR